MHTTHCTHFHTTVLVFFHFLLLYTCVVDKPNKVSHTVNLITLKFYYKIMVLHWIFVYFMHTNMHASSVCSYINKINTTCEFFFSSFIVLWMIMIEVSVYFLSICVWLNFTNISRTWKYIDTTTLQYSLDLTLENYASI